MAQNSHRVTFKQNRLKKGMIAYRQQLKIIKAKCALFDRSKCRRHFFYEGRRQPPHKGSAFDTIGSPQATPAIFLVPNLAAASKVTPNF